MANGEIKFKVGFDVNKANLDNLRQTLSHLKSELGKQIDFSKSLKTDKANRELIEVQTTINNVQNALRKSFNTDLGTLNVAKFNAALKNIGIDKIERDFSKMGAAGQIAFKNIATQTMTTNMQLKQSHSMIDKMATTLGNTLKWNISSGAINRMTGAIQQAWGFTKSLDNSLNDIMIVTGKSADEMERFSRQANKAAKELSAGTTDYTKASLIYYQQGLSDEEVAARAETTLKVANVTGQNADTVSQNLTAVWNGYKVSAEEAELYIDKLSAVAATTAADLDGLSTGMSKVASAANLMGVDVDQLNATLATVISVTQQAPESVGTAFKTIYARMGDIEAGLDTETTLGEYTSKVKEIAGVNVLDINGQLRDMGEVIEEIGDKWTTLSREQQVALSQAMAGTRQYNNLLALFDSWDMYTNALNESANAAGTLQEQQETYQQTVKATLQELRTAFEGLYMELFDVETVKDMVDMLTSVMEKTEGFVKAVGGGGNALSALGAIATRVFSKQIAQGIATTITNFKIAQDNTSQLAAQFQTIELFGGRQNVAGGDAYLQKLTEMKKSVLDLGNLVTNEQHEQANSIIKTTNELQNQKIAYEESLAKAEDFLKLDPGSLSAETYKDDTKAQEEAEKAVAAKEEQYQKLFEIEKEYQKKRIEYDKQVNKTIQSKGDDYKKNLTEEQKIREDLNKTIHKNIKASVEQTEKMNLSEEEQKELNQALQKYNDLWNEIRKNTSKGQAPKLTDEARQAGEEVLGIVDKVANNFKNKTNGAKETVKNASSTMKDDMEKAAEAADRSWKNFINNLQTVKNIQSFVQILGGINQIASGLRSLSNLAKIWNDEDLSFGEKAFQIISAISMGLSMIMSGTLAVVTLLPVLTGLVNKDTVAKEANAAATAKGGIANTAFGKSISGLITKFKAMSTATKVASLSIGGLVAILSIAAIAYGAYTDSQERARENAITDAKATLEEVKAKQEESKKVEELTDNYSKLYQQYKETGKASEEFKTVADDVIEALGVQDVAVLKLTGDYAELTKRILENKKTKLEADKEEAEKGVESQNKIISNILSIEKKSDNKTGGSIRESSGIDTENLEGKNFLKISLGAQAGIQSDDNVFADEIDYTELLQKVGLNYFSNTSNDLYIEKGNMEAGKFYGKLLEVEKLAKEKYSKEEYERSTFYEYLQEIKNDDELKAAYQAWEEQSKLLTDAVAGLAVYGEDLIYDIPEIDSQKEYKTKKNEVKEALRGTDEYKNASKEELESAAINLISKYFDKEKVQGYEDRIAFSEEIGKKVSPELAMPVKGAEEQKILEDYNKDKQKRQNTRQEIEDEIAKLSDEEFSAFTTVVNIDKLKSKEIFDTYIDYAREYAKAQEIELKISVTEDLANGKKITDLTEEQQNALKDLEAEYPELQAIQDKTSTEYISNLLKIQQLLEEQKIKAEEKATNVLINYALELNVNTDEFEETMKDIAEQQYKVVVAVKADVQSDFDNLVDNMTDIDSMASKIGDDFIVAASDLEELNDMFPGILENMKITEDGSVQLNSTIAKEAIEASKAQIKADTAATVEKLLNQAKEMEAKRDAAKNVAKILRDSITNEEVADTLKADLDNALQVLKSDNSASVAEQEQNDAKDVAETAAASATEMANNYGEAYKKMSEDAIEWAKTAQNAIKASTDINVNIPELPVNFGGLNLSSSVTIKESNKADLQSSEEMDGLTDADKEEIAAYYDSVGDSWDRLASNTFGKAMELMAREEESENKLNNIQSGKGADGQKDSSSKEPDKEDKIEEEIDRYREVNELLARQEKSLNRLQKEQNKLYGKDLIKNLEEQSKILKEQEETLRRKLEIAREENKELKNEISQQGIKFDDYGYIINYQEAIQAKQDELNIFIDAYNKMSKEEQENHKEELQKRKENFEDFKASIDRYATLINEEIPEIATSISDSTVQQAENKIKAFEIEIEIKLDMNEAKRQWASFMKDYYYRDNPRKQAEQLYNTAKVEYSDFTIQRNAAQDTQKEIDKLLNGKGSIYKNTEEGMKKAKEDFTNYYQEALSSYQDTFNAVEESKQLWLTGIDDTINTLNKNVEVYSQLDSLYNHDKNMITMLYGEDAFESLDKIYEKMNTNNQKEIINIKKRKDYYKEMMDVATNDEERKKWKQAWLNATDELNAKTEETVSLILEKHSKTIESIINGMNKSLTNGLGLEYIGKEWDLIQKQSEQYFDSVEKGFELQGLQNSFDEALDATDSIAGQARINKLMEEQMKMLREKDKLTKYDVDRAQLLLDIELKRIALEEARQNKSTMRLRRDAQGNYSYQYVEDEEATKAAEDDLQKSEYDLYKLDKGQAETSADNILSTYNKITEEISRIQNDNTLTQEERDAELKLLEDKYGDILQTDLDNFSQASKNLGEEGLKNIFGEDSETLAFIKSLNEKGIGNYINEIVSKTNDVVEDTQDEIDKTRDKAGEDSKKGEDAYTDNDIDKTTVEDFKRNMSDLITKENEKLDALKQSYDNSLTVLEDIKKEFSSLNKLYHYLLKLQGIEIPTSSTTPSDSSKNKKNSTGNNKPTTSTTPTNKPTTSTTPSITPTIIDATQPTFTPSHSPLSAPLKNGILEIGDSAIFDRGYYSTTSDNSSNTLKYNSSKTVKIVNYRKNDNFPVQIENPGDIPVTGYIWVKEKDLYQYKTGGLVDKTGPAWLDGTKSQPELVLNSKDTQNLLDTVKILRNADSLANSLNRSMSERMEARLNTEFKRLSNMMDIIKIERESGKDSLEQNVHIDADFPNVSDSNEIEQALMNLVNVASQYAYRR